MSNVQKAVNLEKQADKVEAMKAEKQHLYVVEEQAKKEKVKMFGLPSEIIISTIQS